MTKKGRAGEGREGAELDGGKVGWRNEQGQEEEEMVADSTWASSDLHLLNSRLRS